MDGWIRGPGFRRATFELLPLWLRFLEQRGLIESRDRQASLDGLRQLKDTLLKLWSTKKDDPTLARNLESWPRIGSAVPVGT